MPDTLVNVDRETRLDGSFAYNVSIMQGDNTITLSAISEGDAQRIRPDLVALDVAHQARVRNCRGLCPNS